MSRPVPDQVRVAFRTSLVGLMKVKYPDKTEEYLRDLVGKFEQEKLYNVFSGDVVKYLENANAKLLQVDSTAAMIPVPPISVDPPKISAEMSDPIYLNQRQDLTKKFLPLLSTASSKLRQLPAEVLQQPGVAQVLSAMDKVIAILEGKSVTGPQPSNQSIENGATKVLQAAKQIFVKLEEKRKLRQQELEKARKEKEEQTAKPVAAVAVASTVPPVPVAAPVLAPIQIPNVKKDATEEVVVEAKVAKVIAREDFVRELKKQLRAELFVTHNSKDPFDDEKLTKRVKL